MSALSDFKHGRWLEYDDPHLVSSITELDWVQDGIDRAEWGTIQDILHLAAVSSNATTSAASLSWVKDGVNDREAQARTVVLSFDYAIGGLLHPPTYTSISVE